jgi:hypothetical protein
VLSTGRCITRRSNEMRLRKGSKQKLIHAAKTKDASSLWEPMLCLPRLARLSKYRTEIILHGEPTRCNPANFYATHPLSSPAPIACLQWCGTQVLSRIVADNQLSSTASLPSEGFRCSMPWPLLRQLWLAFLPSQLSQDTPQSVEKVPRPMPNFLNGRGRQSLGFCITKRVV